MIFLNSKESVIDDIFSIPEGWNIDRMISLGKFYKGNNITKSELVDKGFPCILYSHIYTKFDRIFTEVDSYIDENKFLISTKIKKGDFLFTSSGETVEDIGKCILYNGENNISIGGDIIVFSLFDQTKFDNKFLSYVFNSDYFNYQKSSNSNGEIVVHIYEKQLREIKFTYPFHSEQNLISKYLDKKTEKIDSLIEKIKKKIELLKEQKTALINQYVTKGLDLNIELKDTGISYIGKIPNHWTITRIKFVSEIINGFAFPSESFSKDNPIPVIRIGDINQPINLEKSMKVNSDTLSKYQEFCTRKNDILVAMTGGTIGKSALFSSHEISLINQRVCAFRSNSKVNQKFLYLFITSLIFKLQVDLNCIGGAQPNIGKDELMNFHIVLPPLDEQKEIANILNRKMSILEKIIKKETNRIFLMHEYRQSLISSVVTGKIRITEDML